MQLIMIYSYTTKVIGTCPKDGDRVVTKRYESDQPVEHFQYCTQRNSAPVPDDQRLGAGMKTAAEKRLLYSPVYVGCWSPLDRLPHRQMIGSRRFGQE